MNNNFTISLNTGNVHALQGFGNIKKGLGNSGSQVGQMLNHIVISGDIGGVKQVEHGVIAASKEPALQDHMVHGNCQG